MTPIYITDRQLPRLQVLYHQLASKSLGMSTDREARLAWASEQLGRSVASYRDLTSTEAKQLIDALQLALGIPETAPAGSGRRRVGSSYKSRERAHAAGTEGRRGEGNSRTLISRQEWEIIDGLLQQLEWRREQLDAWLRSPSSPLGRRSNPELRTMGDANKVIWPLKRMVQRKERLEAKKKATV